MRRVVVLPAPLGPRNPVTVPGSQRNVTSETMVRPPSCLVSASVWIMPTDSRPAGFADTVRGLRSPGPAAVTGSDFGRGSRPWRSPSLDPRAMARQATARFTNGLSGWLRSALPGVVVDAPDGERGRRDRIVDATIYLVAFAISAATLAGTWQMHPPWLRVVAVVVGIATLVSLHWRRTHPGAVGIGIGAVSLVILTASGANLAATFNAAIRARGRDLAVIAGLLIAWALASPLLYPPAGSYWGNAGVCLLVTGVGLGWGLFIRARRGSRWASSPRRGRAAARRAARTGRSRRGRRPRGRAAADRPRDARRARPPPLAALRPRRRARVSPRRTGRGGRRGDRRDPREREDRARGAARRDRRPSRGRRREPDTTAPADTRRPRWPRRGVAGGRDAGHRPDRAGRRGPARRHRAHRVPDRAGRPDERAQARAEGSGDAHRPRARRRPAGRGPQPRTGGRRRDRAAARGGDRPDRPHRARLARRRHARARRRPRRRVRPACEAATMIRVLLVDDDALVRSGLRIMLAGAANLNVVAEAADGREVLGAVDLHRPDVVLMDIRMPQLDGIAATRLLAAQPDPPAVVVLTTFDADELVLRALQAGAAGFLLKDTPPAEIVRAIELVHAGDGMLSPAVTRRLISLVAGDSDAGVRREHARDLMGTLSPREHDVALAVGRGHANAEIAAALHLSVPTVKAHVSRLLDKLDVDNRVQIALLVHDATGGWRDE